MSATYRGTCLCGSVTFELCGEFQSFYLCHCHRCQKDTGSAHAAKQRAWFLSLCGEMGSEHQLMYLDVTDVQCLAQIGQRRLEQPERANFDTEAVFHYVSQFFEVPEAREGLNIVTVAKPL